MTSLQHVAFWGFRYCGIWCYTLWWMVPDISNKHSVFICRVRQSQDYGTMFVEHIMTHSSNDSVIFHSETLL